MTFTLARTSVHALRLAHAVFLTVTFTLTRTSVHALRLAHAVCLTVTLTLARTSGAALSLAHAVWKDLQQMEEARIAALRQVLSDYAKAVAAIVPEWEKVVRVRVRVRACV